MDVGIGNLNLNEGKDYDGYLNLFEGRNIEKTLQTGSDIIIQPAQPVTNHGVCVCACVCVCASIREMLIIVFIPIFYQVLTILC